MVLPGTELWRKAEALGLDFDPEPPYHVRSHASMTADDIAYGWKIVSSAHSVFGDSKAVRLLGREQGLSLLGHRRRVDCLGTRSAAGRGERRLQGEALHPGGLREAADSRRLLSRLRVVGIPELTAPQNASSARAAVRMSAVCGSVRPRAPDGSRRTRRPRRRAAPARRGTRTARRRCARRSRRRSRTHRESSCATIARLVLLHRLARSRPSRTARSCAGRAPSIDRAVLPLGAAAASTRALHQRAPGDDVRSLPSRTTFAPCRTGS